VHGGSAFLGQPFGQDYGAVVLCKCYQKRQAQAFALMQIKHDCFCVVEMDG
jgi:hypothetical protein